MKQFIWIIIFAMCTTMMYGKRDPYYTAIVSADKLLYIKPGETVTVVMAVSPVQDNNTPGVHRYDFVINGTPISVTMTNGVILSMVRDGKDLGISPPKLELAGNEEWIKLSKHYHDEALRLMSFTRFLDVGESTKEREVTVTGVDTEGRHYKFSCETSGKLRLVNYLFDGEISYMYEKFLKEREPAFKNEIASFNATFSFVDKDTKIVLDNISASALSNSFKATFFLNGGLKSLHLTEWTEKFNVTMDTLREWDEKGNLISNRDLIKDPLPDPFEQGIRKGGNEPNDTTTIE